MPTKPKKAPAKVKPKPLQPAPADFVAKSGSRGQVLGRTLTEVTPRVGEEYGKGQVELIDLDGHFVKASSGFYVEAKQPFYSPIEPGKTVVMDGEYVIESVMG